MSSSNSKIVSHGSIYLVGNIMRRMVGFIMLPIYTRYLTPEHYGTIELLSMVIDVVGILFGLKIAEAVFRFYFQYENEKDRGEVIFTSLALAGLLNTVGVLILLMGAGPISQVIFGTQDAAGLLALFSFTLIFQSVTETVLTFVRAQQRPWLFVGVSTAKLIVQLALNIYFVVVLQMAVEGVILSALISGVIVTIPLVVYTISKTGFSFSLEKARAMTIFSYPLVLTSLISFYMTFGDRYFLRVFGGGLDEVGVYALGYRFGFLLSFIVGAPFFNIWNSEKYVVARQPDAQERLRSAFLILSAALLFVTVGISVYVYDVLRVMASPEFWGAYVVVPIVMLGYVFQNWTGFTNLGLLLHDRTGDIATGTALSAVLVTIGYLLLIPPFGAVGAAVATTLAFGARMLWIEWRAERVHPIGYPWGRVMAMTALAAVAWGLSRLAPEPLWLSLAFNTLIFLGFTAALLTGPLFLPADLRQGIRAALRTRRFPGRHMRPEPVPAPPAPLEARSG